MMHITMECLFLFCLIGIVFGTRDERLVLHNDQDINQVITSMQAEISSLKSDNQALKATVSTLQTNILSAPVTSGSVYVRWGKDSCPGNGTEMIYNGQMAGNQYNEYGGGSNSLCLPNDPTWGKYIDGLDSLRSRIHGTEIDQSNADAQILFGHNVLNEDIPCAVCRTTRASNVMIPARVNCYPGWIMEYHGYVVSSGSDWHNTLDYTCLDAGLDFFPGGVGNDDENILVTAEIVCGKSGSITCPPYVNGRELACVVCSK